MRYTIMTEEEIEAIDLSRNQLSERYGSTLYTIDIESSRINNTDTDTDTDTDTNLYKMNEDISIESTPFCIICLQNSLAPYGCFQCKECIICENCINILPRKHKLKCPICRKGKQWCKIIETNKAYILTNNEETVRANNRIANRNRRDEDLNNIFRRAISFIICIFLPFFVFMGMKFMQDD